MNNHTKPNEAQPFLALEIAYQVISVLREIVPVIRREDAEAARQIVRSASSVAANLAEGNGRVGADRRRFFRIAAGSAQETRAHLRVANAWGWLEAKQYANADALLDRQVALLWKLTH
jgi:four helix bundle protein